MQWRTLDAPPGSEGFPGPLRWRVLGFAWADVDARARALDGSLRIEIRAPEHPHAQLDVWVHLRLHRPGPSEPWEAPLSEADVLALVELAQSWNWGPEADDARLIIEDGYWRLLEQPEATQAQRYPGRCWEEVEASLELGSAGWMQDWPLEVSDGKRLAEFCAAYDAATHDELRFDLMALILYSYEDRLYTGPAPETRAWLDQRLRQNFALHGHSVAYWLRLNDQPHDPSEGPGGFPCSPQLRELWAQCLLPIEVEPA